MSARAFRRRLVLSVSLLVLLGGLFTACQRGGQPAGAGKTPPPTPSHHRDFDHADSLAAYLRSDARPLIGAHRGGATDGFPENAIPTSRHALTHGPVLLEVDVRMTKDSVLVLMHDETLGRTTTGRGEIRSNSLNELRGLRLVTNAGDTTRYPVPTVAEALAWAEGRAVLQLDVKDDVPRSLVVDVLRRMDGLDQALVITYELADARWYHQRMPDLLLSVSTETRDEAVAHVEAIEPSRLVAFAGVGEPSSDVLSYLSSRNVPVTVGTFGELDQRARQRGLVVYRDLFRQGVDIIATDDVALASQAADTYRSENTEAVP